MLFFNTYFIDYLRVIVYLCNTNKETTTTKTTKIMNTTLFDETVQVLIEKRNALIEEHKDIRKRIEDNNAAFTILLEERKLTTDEHDLELLKQNAFIMK